MPDSIFYNLNTVPDYKIAQKQEHVDRPALRPILDEVAGEDKSLDETELRAFIAKFASQEKFEDIAGRFRLFTKKPKTGDLMLWIYKQATAPLDVFNPQVKDPTGLFKKMAALSGDKQLLEVSDFEFYNDQFPPPLSHRDETVAERKKREVIQNKFQHSYTLFRARHNPALAAEALAWEFKASSMMNANEMLEKVRSDSVRYDNLLTGTSIEPQAMAFQFYVMTTEQQADINWPTVINMIQKNLGMDHQFGRDTLIAAQMTYTRSQEKGNALKVLHTLVFTAQLFRAKKKLEESAALPGQKLLLNCVEFYLKEIAEGRPLFAPGEEPFRPNPNAHDEDAQDRYNPQTDLIHIPMNYHHYGNWGVLGRDWFLRAFHQAWHRYQDFTCQTQDRLSAEFKALAMSEILTRLLFGEPPLVAPPGSWWGGLGRYISPHHRGMKFWLEETSKLSVTTNDSKNPKLLEAVSKAKEKLKWLQVAEDINALFEYFRMYEARSTQPDPATMTDAELEKIWFEKWIRIPLELRDPDSEYRKELLSLVDARHEWWKKNKKDIDDAFIKDVVEPAIAKMITLPVRLPVSNGLQGRCAPAPAAPLPLSVTPTEIQK